MGKLGAQLSPSVVESKVKGVGSDPDPSVLNQAARDVARGENTSSREGDGLGLASNAENKEKELSQMKESDGDGPKSSFEFPDDDEVITGTDNNEKVKGKDQKRKKKINGRRAKKLVDECLVISSNGEGGRPV